MSPHGPGFSGALHSHDAEYPDDNWNLYALINREDVKCLNATHPQDALGVFCPFVHRLNEAHNVASNCDEELIITIHFLSPCSIRKVMFIGGGESTQHPRTIKAYANKDNVDFTNIGDLIPSQVFDNLTVNNSGTVEQVTTLHQFTNLSCLTFYVTRNHGHPCTILRYIGMQGEHTHYRREAVNAEYEVVCNGQDVEAHSDKRVAQNFGV